MDTFSLLSVIGGGKFANGARAAAFVSLYNGEVSGARDTRHDPDSSYPYPETGEERRRLITAHDELRAKVRNVLSDADDAIVFITREEQVTLLRYTYMRILDDGLPLLRNYLVDHAYQDTFLRGDGHSSRQFHLEGIGVVRGGDYNYIAVGMMAAHHGHSLVGVTGQSLVWNSVQYVFGGFQRHNVNQLYTGTFWAAYGHEFYHSQQGNTTVANVLSKAAK